MRAQMYIMEEDENQRVENELGNGEWNNVIVHGSSDDQANFVPLGEGLMLLAALSGIYFLLNNKKENKK